MCFNCCLCFYKRENVFRAVTDAYMFFYGLCTMRSAPLAMVGVTRAPWHQACRDRQRGGVAWCQYQEAVK